MKIYLLCEVLENYGEWDVIGWSFNQQELEEKALEMCWNDYSDQMKKWDGTYIPICSPAETTFRKFYVEEVEQIYL